MEKKESQFIYINQNKKTSRFKLITYWNDGEKKVREKSDNKVDPKRGCYYSYEKFDTRTNTYSNHYSLSKLMNCIRDFTGKYNSAMIYTNIPPEQREKAKKEGRGNIQERKLFKIDKEMKLFVNKSNNPNVDNWQFYSHVDNINWKKFVKN